MVLNIFEWVEIPEGDVLLGSDLLVDKVASNFDWARRFEVPQHFVNLSSFQISRYPITNSQWEQFLTSTHYDWNFRSKLWHAGIPIGKENHPVVWVTWHDTIAFCEWAKVRLPTEAEWEKAACGPNKNLYPWGNLPPSDEFANYARQVGDTTPVDHYPKGKSDYGVFDMAGNTWEWTSTIWGTQTESPEFKYPYQKNDGRENLNDPNIMRVVKAGGWKYSSDLIRCAYRDWNKPDTKGSGLGFRVVAQSN